MALWYCAVASEVNKRRRAFGARRRAKTVGTMAFAARRRAVTVGSLGVWVFCWKGAWEDGLLGVGDRGRLGVWEIGGKNGRE